MFWKFFYSKLKRIHYIFQKVKGLYLIALFLSISYCLIFLNPEFLRLPEIFLIRIEELYILVCIWLGISYNPSQNQEMFLRLCCIDERKRARTRFALVIADLFLKLVATSLIMVLMFQTQNDLKGFFTTLPIAVFACLTYGIVKARRNYWALVLPSVTLILSITFHTPWWPLFITLIITAVGEISVNPNNIPEDSCRNHHNRLKSGLRHPLWTLATKELLFSKEHLPAVLLLISLPIVLTISMIVSSDAPTLLVVRIVVILLSFTGVIMITGQYDAFKHKYFLYVATGVRTFIFVYCMIPSVMLVLLQSPFILFGSFSTGWANMPIYLITSYIATLLFLMFSFLVINEVVKSMLMLALLATTLFLTILPVLPSILVMAGIVSLRLILFAKGQWRYLLEVSG